MLKLHKIGLSLFDLFSEHCPFCLQRIWAYDRLNFQFGSFENLLLSYSIFSSRELIYISKESIFSALSNAVIRFTLSIIVTV